jgi:hypothetical protein
MSVILIVCKPLKDVSGGLDSKYNEPRLHGSRVLMCLSIEPGQPI